MNRYENLLKLLTNHEGMKLKPYVCTAGKLTIGVGRNLQDLGITKDEALYLLQNDLMRVISESKTFPWFKELNDVRQDAVLDLLFCVGMTKMLGFKKTLKALSIGDFNRAADEILDSKWAKQVGKRATDVASMIRTGSYAGVLY